MTRFNKPQIALVSLAAGCLLTSATFAFIYRSPVDLNMDGAPAASVPGYTGPLYSAKGKLVGYAQPPVVDLQHRLKPLQPAQRAVAATRNHSRALQPLALR